jgi:O-antigen/teichoic acid export membrane protein
MLKHLGAMGFARGLYAVSQAVLLILLARDIGPHGFGVIAAFLAAHTFLFLLAGMNTPTFATRELTLRNTPNAVASIRLNAIVMGLAITIALVSTSLLLGQPLLMLAVAGNAIAVWSERLTENRLAVSYAEKRMRPAVITLVVRSLAPLALYLGLAEAGLDALLAFALARVVAGIASQALGLLLIRLPHVADDDLTPVKRLVRVQAPLATSTSMGALRTLDSVLVVAVAGASASGVYSAVSRVVSPFNTLAASVTPVLVPRAAVATAAKVRRMLDVFVIAGLGLSAITLALLPYRESLVTFVFGPQFAGGGVVLVWVLLRVGPVAVTPLISTALQSQGSDRLAALNSVGTSLCALAGVAGGALVGGAAGAAAGFAAVSLIGMVALWLTGRQSLANKLALGSLS